MNDKYEAEFDFNKQEWEKYFNMGISKQQQGQHEEAIQYCKEALKVLTFAQNNTFKDEETKTFTLLAYCLDSMEKYQDAIEYYEKVLITTQDSDDKELEWRMCIGLALAYMKLGQYDNCIKHSKHALDTALVTNDPNCIAHSYKMLGTGFAGIHDYPNCIECFQKAIDVYQQLGGDSQALSECYADLSKTYQYQGKYHEALHFQEKSLRLSEKMEDKRTQARLLLNIGNLHRTLNNNEQAADFYEQSVVLAKQINDISLQWKCYVNLGNVLFDSGKHQEAISKYMESLKIAEELDDKKAQAMVHMNCGNCYFTMQLFQDALQHFNHSGAIVSDINATPTLTEALLYQNIAEILYMCEEYLQSISASEKCLEIALSIGDKETEWSACHKLGKIYYSLCKESQEQEAHVSYMSKSEKYLKQALDCYDYLLTHLRHHDRFKISKFDQFTKTYQLLVSAYIETQRPQQALLVSDRGRARALTDRLVFNYGMSQDEQLSTKPLTYPDVESVLSKDAFTLLHYFLQDESLFVWVLSKDAMILKELGKAQFVSAVESLYIKEKKAEENTDGLALACQDMKIDDEGTCETRSLDDCLSPTDQHGDGVPESVTRDDTGREKVKLNTQSLEVLYNTLIAPVLTDIQHDEIVIVPDGRMYTVPFAALKDPNTGKYLSESKRIRLVPSIAVLKLLQECPVDHHSQQGALIVGNPTVTIVKFKGKDVFWKALKQAQKEASKIADVLKDESGNVQQNITLLTEKQATKDAVLAKMKEGTGIIHIAAHGDADHGEIALAPIPSQDRQDIPEEKDYLLTMKDVQEVGVKAQLVVLSCCHSGRGEIRAEGMIGLSRAFLAAGARAVVASLWAIDSKVTRKFMVRFYLHLCRGHSTSLSLNKAMKDVRKHLPKYNEPTYWAPFCLIGDDVTINFGQST